MYTVLNPATDMRRLTTGIRSEKCDVRRFRRYANVIECTYTNLDSKGIVPVLCTLSTSDPTWSALGLTQWPVGTEQTSFRLVLV